MRNTQTSLTKTEPRKPLVKIRHLDNYTGLRANLIAISYLLGVREAPNEKIIIEMIGIIKLEFNFFTVQDITDAVKKGLAGKLTINGKMLDLETYNNFSIPYVCKFLVAYREYLNNNSMLLPKVQESPVMTKEEKKQERDKWLKDTIFPLFEKYFKTGEYDFPDYGNALYNYLDKKFINFASEKKEKIKEMARLELLKEYRIEKIAKPNQRNEIGKIITDILTGDKKTDAEVKGRGRNIALKIFLAECKEMGRDLIAEIKEYENL